MREITSHTNETVKMLRSLKQKKYRDQHGLYIIEGEKTIAEAIAARQPFSCILASEISPFVQQADQGGIDVVSVPYTVIEQVSDTKSPPPVIACLQKTPAEVQGDFIVALDGLSDPKNVGTVIRTADAVGASGVLVSADSADFYGPKAQRAAMGSTFHIPVQICHLAERLHAFRQNGGFVVAGSLNGICELPPLKDKRICVIIGNEAQGISAEVHDLADALYRIPIYGAAESLNAGVAAGIILYEVRRLKG